MQTDHSLKNSLKNSLKTANRKSKLKFIHKGKIFLSLSLVLSIVWIFGYFQINLLWIIMAMAICMVYYYRQIKNKKRFNFGLNLSLDEKESINNFSKLPSWVFFPDFERVEWINKICTRLWPSISRYLRERLLDKILPKLKKSFKNQLEVKVINFGDSPPKIGGIKFYDNDYLNRSEIIIDAEVYFYGNGELTFKYNSIVFGIKHLEVKAHVRIQLSNFVPKPPFIGAITLMCLDNPKIKYDFTDAAVFLNIPGIKNVLRETISDTISQLMVIPNRIPINLIRNIDIRQLMFPIPEGMVRINVIEGGSLKASDTNLIGKNTSDPYVVIRVGAEKFKTKVIDKNLNPRWNEYFEAIVDTKAHQKIEFTVFDKDPNKDDFLGEAFFDVENVFSRGNIDVWLPLQKINTGTIHVNFTWLKLSTDPNVFDTIEEKNRKIDAPLSVAFLYFFVDSAKNLKKVNYDDNPSAFAEISLGNKQKATAIISKSQNPVWENAFHFTLHSIYSSDIKIEVKDEKTKKSLGNFSYSIQQLVNEKDMEISQTVSLQHTDGVESTLTFYAALRALDVMERRRTSSNTSKLSSPGSPNTNKPPIHGIPEHDSSDDEIDDNNNKLIKGVLDLSQIDSTGELNMDREESMDSTSTSKVKLRNNSLDSEAIDSDQVGPSVHVTLRYSHKKVFYIVIHKVQNLVIINEKNPKIYIKINLFQNDGKRHKWHTKSVPHNESMTFDETFQLLIEKETLQRGTFNLDFKLERQFSINNKKIGSSEIDFSNWDLSSMSKWYPIQIKNFKHSVSFSRMSVRSKSPP